MKNRTKYISMTRITYSGLYVVRAYNEESLRLLKDYDNIAMWSMRK